MKDKQYIYEFILNEIKKNNKITEMCIAKKLNCSDRTIRRYYSDLKKNNLIKRIGYGKNRYWMINK